MKNLLKLIFASLIAASSLVAQDSSNPVLQGSGAPPDPCTFRRVYIDVANDALYAAGGTSTCSWFQVGGGGGGTPGSPDGSLQFNDSGSFAGVPNSSVDPSTGDVTLGADLVVNADSSNTIGMTQSGSGQINIADAAGNGFNVSNGNDPSTVVVGAGVGEYYWQTSTDSFFIAAGPLGGVPPGAFLNIDAGTTLSPEGMSWTPDFGILTGAGMAIAGPITFINGNGDSSPEITTCTGVGDGACDIAERTSDFVGIWRISGGDTGTTATGTITVALSQTYGNNMVCEFTLANGDSSWTTGATVIEGNPSPSSVTANWSNNLIPLPNGNGGTGNLIVYHCFPEI